MSLLQYLYPAFLALISPDGRQVVYTLSPFSKKDTNPISTLWIADIDKPDSARPLTSGLVKDEQPRWSPDGRYLAFVSDRAHGGTPSAIYLMPMTAMGGEPYAITSTKCEKGIVAHEWSYDGTSIAFVSEDEKTAERKQKETDRDDAKVYDTDWDWQRLRLVDVKTKQVTTVVDGDRHVHCFSWSRDSEEITYTVHATPDFNSPFQHGVEMHILQLSSSATRSLTLFSGQISTLIWSSSEAMYFTASVVPNHVVTAGCIYRLDIQTKELTTYFGIDDCALALGNAAGCVVALVQTSDANHLYAIGPWEKPVRHIYRSLSDLDAFVASYDAEKNRFLVVNNVNTAATPDEISAVEVSGEDQPQQSGKRTLSSHNRTNAARSLATSQQFAAFAPDGHESDGVLFTPTGPGPFPTVVLVHGGPYFRVTQSFAVCHNLEMPLLTSAGYAVLCPNYRGSSGRGEQFAAVSRGGMGEGDYMDVIAVLKEAIQRKLVDESRVAIGGWSQGGFLSCLAVTRNEFHFQAALCGAGVTDWDMMTMTSQIYEFEADLAGGSPWEADYALRPSASAVWNMQKVTTPILILHGEEDSTVPLTQAIAFWRGCQHWKVPVEMVVYPREGHMVRERLHVIDMWERIVRFHNAHLK